MLDRWNLVCYCTRGFFDIFIQIFYQSAPAPLQTDVFPLGAIVRTLLPVTFESGQEIAFNPLTQNVHNNVDFMYISYHNSWYRSLKNKGRLAQQKLWK